MPLHILREFRTFAVRGNVVDLAVGVIIGAAFGKIVTSLVDQVIMPPLGLLISRVDFSKLEWVLRPDNPATAASEKVAIQYGAFVNTVIQFVIVAFAVFILVKAINRLREREAESPAAPAAPTPTEKLLAEIRDELRAGRGADA
ncbi:MAG TPA: large-conductance mechanosensitive channel protein MscL [Caulobacteraceae bacterium]|nr:large-conductance mechanosensitive channel protein MscL [Caulobacteraceae bacterium]